jgi:hypothetical protein
VGSQIFASKLGAKEAVVVEAFLAVENCLRRYVDEEVALIYDKANESILKVVEYLQNENVDEREFFEALYKMGTSEEYKVLDSLYLNAAWRVVGLGALRIFKKDEPDEFDFEQALKNSVGIVQRIDFRYDEFLFHNMHKRRRFNTSKTFSTRRYDAFLERFRDWLADERYKSGSKERREYLRYCIALKERCKAKRCEKHILKLAYTPNFDKGELERFAIRARSLNQQAYKVYYLRTEEFRDEFEYKVEKLWGRISEREARHRELWKFGGYIEWQYYGKIRYEQGKSCAITDVPPSVFYKA